MVNPVSVTILIVVLVAALVGMAVSWRLRWRRQARFVPPPAPADTGSVLAEAEGLYLATTFAGRPLERVSVAGLGFRARCRFAVTTMGVLLERDGAAPLLLAVTGAGTGTWTLDRAVEPGGLLVLGWTLPETGGPGEAVESSFRFDAPAQVALMAALPRRQEVPHAAD